MYRWLRDNGLPEGFQILCLSCNESKGTGAADQRTQEAGHGTRGANGDTWEAGPSGAALRVTMRMSVTAVSPAITTNTSMIP